jgi:TPR repeat protein
VDAEFHLALYYLFYGFHQEPPVRAEMEELLRTAAGRDHPDAVYFLSQLSPNGPQRDALLRKSAELGSLEGQRDLGAKFATGDWTGPQDLVRATHWYRLAAERGHADAQYNLGFMYLLGEGVSADPVEGLRWLHLAADQAEEAAFRLLADLYRNGHYGVPVDPEEAARWEEKDRLAQQAQAEEDDAEA